MIRGKKVSLSDVARRSGVSLATVSRVLSGAKYPITGKTQTRVLQAARELGYTPNAIARALATNVNRLVGVIIGDITDTYFAEIVRGIEDVAGNHGYVTVVCNGERNPVRERSYFNTLIEQNAAAVLLAGGYYPDLPQTADFKEAVQSFRGRTNIVCLADRNIPDIPVITVDNQAILRDLTVHLIKLGHKRIAYVGGPEGFSISNERRQGFEEAMRDSGLDPSWQLPGGFGIDFGRTAATSLLTRQLPDAVIAVSDETALGICAALGQAGIKIPQQISVAGIDDVKYSQLLHLTTVHQPTYELGALGARRALKLDEEKQPLRTILSHRLIIRGTTSWSPATGQMP